MVCSTLTVLFVPFMMTAVSPFIHLFRYSLQPIAPFTWFGFSISTLDIVATVRLCLLLRQIREMLYLQHVRTKGSRSVEEKSFVRNVSTTLMVVYGGEAVTAPFLGLPPSFMISGVVPALYIAVQAVIDYLPTVPEPTVTLELPLAVVDGFTRAFLLCNLIPPIVTTHTSPAIATSPWTLLLASLITANGGFFFTNLFSFLNPTPLALQTPPELQAYGWSIADLWCAPLVTGLYALLTHAQPFWADVHALFSGVGGSTSVKSNVEPVDPETARAVCAILLAALFVGRTAKNFGLWQPFEKVQSMMKVERDRPAGKAKTQ